MSVDPYIVKVLVEVGYGQGYRAGIDAMAGQDCGAVLKTLIQSELGVCNLKTGHGRAKRAAFNSLLSRLGVNPYEPVSI